MSTAAPPREAAAPAGRRAEILAAALAAFDERGYAVATIADVRKRSGASVGSIYHHFGDKEGIAAALYVDSLRDYQRGVGAAFAKDPGAEAGIRALVRHHLRWVERNPERARFLLERREPEVAEASQGDVESLNEVTFALVREWLVRQIDAGLVRSLRLQLFYVIVLGPSQEFARNWLRAPGRGSIRGAERVLAEAAWNAVRAQPKGD